MSNIYSIDLFWIVKKIGLVLKNKDIDSYKMRYGQFRVMSHYKNKWIVVNSIKLKNKNIYKSLCVR